MLVTLKTAIKNAPIIGRPLVRLGHAIARYRRYRTAAHNQVLAAENRQPFRSAEYWEIRYRVGRNSGAGSYNRLAAFKTHFLNEFVRSQDIGSVIEFGCGDGNQLTLACYPSYVGVDVSDTALALCRDEFASDPTKRFIGPEMAAGQRAELALSLDVIYHLVEDSVFDGYMRDLFGAADRYVIVYASNKDEPPVRHVRHRQFTRWVAACEPDWLLQQIVPNAYPFDPADPDNTSFADFYVFGRAR